MQQVRPSKLPLAFECPSSLLPTESPLGGVTEESELGEANHYVAGAIVLGTPVDVAAVARSYGADEAEVELVRALSERMWREVARYFPAPRVEYRVTSEMLGGGTCDVLHHDGETAAVWDWKTGRVQRQHRHQMAGYAYSVREQLGMPRSGFIGAGIGWPRLGAMEFLHFTSDELDAWAREFMGLERDIGRRFSPGEHCGFCPRHLECVAYNEALASSSRALVALQDDVAKGETSAVSAERLAAVYPRVKMLERAIELYDQLLKAALANGARLPTGDGRVLYMGEQRKTVIDPQLAWPVLKEALTPDELAASITVSKGKVEEAVEAKAGDKRGAKKAAREDLFKKLEAAGAVQVVITPRLTAGKGE